MYCYMFWKSHVIATYIPFTYYIKTFNSNLTFLVDGKSGSIFFVSPNSYHFGEEDSNLDIFRCFLLCSTIAFVCMSSV